MKPLNEIIVRGASEHNLREVDVNIPRDALTVITGLSGSGKSSLAFDTIYAEGQRRYMESLSAYARQYMDQMHKPKVESIDGLSPAISIEQKTVSRNPRSTVGTVTEIYDYLRVLYANLGVPHCPECGETISRQTAEQIVNTILQMPADTKIYILAPVIRGRKGEHRQMLDDARSKGFVRARINGEIVELSETPVLKKAFKHEISIVVDRLAVGPQAATRVLDAVEQALDMAEGLVEVLTVPENESRMFSKHFACPRCGTGVEEITPRLFSFNSPYGQCKTCFGIGSHHLPDESLIVADSKLSIRHGALIPWDDAFSRTGSDKNVYKAQIIREVTANYQVNIETPWNKLAEDKRKLILYGAAATRSKKKDWEGLIPYLTRRFIAGEADLEIYFREKVCEDCDGFRVRPHARAVLLGGRGIGEFCTMDIAAAKRFLLDIEWTERETLIGQQIIKEVTERLDFLENVGLHYLTLDRKAGTLSGGEAQRIRLATQIGSLLTGVLYVLDEPSIGLHQRDNDRLIASLKHLRDIGNTLIVVEHDEQTIRSADYVIDLGPGAGRLGGVVTFQGKPDDLAKNADSLTGKYMRGEVQIEVPAERRKPKSENKVIVRGATHHNLKNIDVEFPLGVFICVTGVSGSGKSTIIEDIFYPLLNNHCYHGNRTVGKHRKIDGIELVDKVVEVDQAPIGRTPRSNPVTYTGVFTVIRDLFARLPESQIRGYPPGRFSFNVKGGRCEECGGDGLKKIEMHFLPDAYVECQVCRGRRFNLETLEVLYQGKNIADVLEMTVEDACEFFKAQPSICHKLTTLRDVGLGYITLGQSSTTLSGGEAQRIKLSRELSKRGTGKTVYILDEPTTGLHFEDIRKLLEVLQALTNQGNTVLVIEHNLDMIKCADWIIDMGPEGGAGGGTVVAAGTPEEVAANPRSITGRYIAPLLSKVAAPKKVKKRAKAIA